MSNRFWAFMTADVSLIRNIAFQFRQEALFWVQTGMVFVGQGQYAAPRVSRRPHPANLLENNSIIMPAEREVPGILKEFEGIEASTTERGWEADAKRVALPAREARREK